MDALQSLGSKAFLRPESVFWHIIAIVAGFGFLGGSAHVFSEPEFRRHYLAGNQPAEKLNWHVLFHTTFRVILAIGTNGIIGASAAIGFAGILAVDKKFSNPIDQDIEVLIAATSLIAGFGGIHILRWLSRRLEEQVKQEVKRQTSELSGEVKSMDTELKAVEQKVKTLDLLANALSFAGGALSVTTPETRREAIKKLEEVLPYYKGQRLLNIFLGRLYESFDEYQRAIHVLTQALSARRTEGLPEDADDAAFYYNIACYRCRIADTSTDTGKQELLREQAWNEIKKVVLINPSDYAEALEDPDFANLPNSDTRIFAQIRP